MADQALALEALRAGAQDFVLKPPPVGEVLSRIIRFACERQQLLQRIDEASHASSVLARRWQLIAEVGETLAQADDVGQGLSNVAQLLVPDAVDCFALFVAGDEEVSAMAEVRHVDEARADTLRDRARALLGPSERDFDRLFGSDWKRDAEMDGKLLAAMQLVFVALGLSSGTAVRVQFAGKTRGLLVLAVANSRADAVTDVAFARSLSERIAIAIDQDRLLRQTHRAVAARDRAVSIVSHDLRSPLNTIQICATALLDPTPAPRDGVRQMAELIQRSSVWMEQIVQDLLDRARLDAGRVVLDRHPTSPGDIISSASAMFEPMAEERWIDFVADSAPDLPEIDVDSHRVLQVLTNLLGNALKFTPPGGRVQVSARRAADESDESGDENESAAVRFTVSDTGPGIPPEEIDHICDWFWQSPRESRSGAGFGLAIAKGMVEAHRRRLHVESIPGRGTSFWFVLPVAAVAAPAIPDMMVPA
jgi:signal transduction histidine kinase